MACARGRLKGNFTHTENKMDRVLYGYPLSANTHKIRILLSLLELPFEERLVDLARGDQRKPDFLALNPAGQVPVLIDADIKISDSHAILVYLARKYGGQSWYSEDPQEQALIMQWLFFDANEIHNGVGYARNHFAFGAPGDGPALIKRARAAMSVVEQRLKDRDWLELGRPTLADLCCAQLLSVAEDTGIELSAFPHINRWLQKMGGIKGYMQMQTLKQFAEMASATKSG
jgi:glutathione S-transferase